MFADGKYVVRCGRRKTEVTPVSEADRATMLGKARFLGPRWTHKAYALARNDQGKYYYVDRIRDPEDSRIFRLFVGVRGNPNLQKMTSVVSDSEGDMFATRSGSLRLILDKHETTWIAGKKKTPLVSCRSARTSDSSTPSSAFTPDNGSACPAMICSCSRNHGMSP